MKVKVYMSFLGQLFIVYPNNKIEYFSNYSRKWEKCNTVDWTLSPNDLLIGEL